MKRNAHFSPFCLLAALVLPAAAQTPLPAAPSTLLYQQQAAQQAGSNFKFVAPSALSGPAGLRVEAPQNDVLPLSLDDAIALGLERNVRILYDRANQRAVNGDRLGVVNALLPDLRASAQSEAQEINLAGMGFKPGLLAGFSKSGLLPPGYKIATIVKVYTTQANISASQQLLNLPDLELYWGSKDEVRVVDLNALAGRGDLILAVGTSYLQILADKSNVANAKAQEEATKTLFDQARAKHDAGVGTNLDALRAQVQYQQRQQDTVAAEAQLAKDTIQLDRIIGLPAGQKLELTDSAPFAELADMDLERAKALAYARRKDYLSLLAQIQVANRELKAVKYQRLPTLAFNGNYGVLGQTTGSYHGVFNAIGSVKFPIFKEGEQRGQEEQIGAQLTSLQQHEADLKVAIDAQIRASMLDVQSSAELVKVAESNVELAKQELADERDRFSAGVDDNLPVSDAVASLTGAQAQLVQALYQFNVAKLQLARNTGVVETQYRTYLGK